MQRQKTSHPPEQYAFYLRKSRADLELEQLGQGETLARHRELLTQLSKLHGIVPEQITAYEEIVSGDTIADRPQMQQLLTDIWAGKYAAVLVVEIERLARGNTSDQGAVAEAFHYSHTKIITPTKVFDPDNEFDEEYFEFGLFMARREYKTIRRRMQAGIQASVKDGNYLSGKAPIGYDVVRENRRSRKLVPNGDADIIRLIFNLCTEEQLSLGGISRRLKELGIAPKGGAEYWDKSTIKEILQNPHYIGLIRWQGRKLTKAADDTGTVRSMTVRNRSPQLYEGKHEPIIMKEQFDRAQELLPNKPRAGGTALVNPLACLLYCSKCGRAIRQQPRPGSPTWPRYIHPPMQSCDVKGIPQTIVIETLVETLSGMIADMELSLDSKRSLGANAQNKAAKAAMERQLEEARRKRLRLFDAYETGVYTSSEFLERKTSNQSTITQLEQSLQELDIAPEIERIENRIISLKQCIALIKDEEVSVESKNKFLRSIISRINYTTINYGTRHGGSCHLSITLK